MNTISLEQAQANLPALIHGLAPGDELIVTENERTIARIVPPSPLPAPRRLGTLQGSVLHIADDFDAPLDEFDECLE